MNTWRRFLLDRCAASVATRLVPVRFQLADDRERALNLRDELLGELQVRRVRAVIAHEALCVLHGCLGRRITARDVPTRRVGGADVGAQPGFNQRQLESNQAVGLRSQAARDLLIERRQIRIRLARIRGHLVSGGRELGDKGLQVCMAATGICCRGREQGARQA